MSRRKSVYLTHRFSAPTAQRETINEVTIDLRIFFPPGCPMAPVQDRLNELVADAVEKLWDHKVVESNRLLGRD